MKTLKDIQHLEGVKVLVRTDFNVFGRDGRVMDDFRLEAAFPTLDFLTEKGAKVIVISHAEANDGSNSSLEPLVVHLGKLGRKVKFVKNIQNAYETIEKDFANGEIFLIENLRMFGDGEKKNDQDFARELASLADLYVNDAFPVCHREHASIVGIPKYLPSYAGIQLEREISHLSKAFTPSHPFLFILAGAKFETKLPIIERFLDHADTIFIGGALANDLLKAKGQEVGISLVSGSDLDLSKIIHSFKLLLPVDTVNQNRETKTLSEVSRGDKILDVVPETMKLLEEKVNKAKFILWNGPLGLTDIGYVESTLELAKMVAGATSRGVETIVGGGDTLAAISKLGLQKEFTLVSTGGGAMLDFLAKGTLPGIEALETSN